MRSKVRCSAMAAITHLRVPTARCGQEVNRAVALGRPSPPGHRETVGHPRACGTEFRLGTGLSASLLAAAPQP